MFTGIIEELGSVRSIEERGENARLVINANTVTEGTNHGDSISVNGVCLTALDITRIHLPLTYHARRCSARRWGDYDPA